MSWAKRTGPISPKLRRLMMALAYGSSITQLCRDQRNFRTSHQPAALSVWAMTRTTCILPQVRLDSRSCRFPGHAPSAVNVSPQTARHLLPHGDSPPGSAGPLRQRPYPSPDANPPRGTLDAPGTIVKRGRSVPLPSLRRGSQDANAFLIRSSVAEDCNIHPCSFGSRTGQHMQGSAQNGKPFCDSSTLW